jgi:general secretion pathway protein D
MKRFGKKLSPFVLSLTVVLGFLTPPTYSQSQFKKFKSKTKFSDSKEKSNKRSKRPSVSNASDSSSSIDVNSANNEKVFGRGSGVSRVKRIKKPESYVNLNPETAFGPEVVESFDFPETSLVDLTKHMQKLTGINLILDKDLKGKVSILAPTAITVGDAWKAYLVALNLNGYSLVRSGEFFKIVNNRDIRYTPTKIYTGSYTPNTENYVMRIISLKNIDSTEITRSFRPFMSRYGRIIEIKQTNTVIIQDTGSNINRLVRLIKFIDVPGHEETLQIIPVRQSSAQEIAKLLDQILNSGKSSKSSKSSSRNIGRIIAEPRTNSIIAMANAEGSKQLRFLINKLDVKVAAGGSGQIHVYYLQHGDAETLSKTLSGLVTTTSSKNSSRFSKSRSSNSLFAGPVKITADKDNNALVVTASPTDYLTIKEVVFKLDVARDQVYVEGLIMETAIDKSRALGVSVIGAYGTGGASKMGYNNEGGDLLNVLTNNITALGGFFAGAGIGKSITQTVGGQTLTINTVNALIKAVARNSNTNVLATPQILALDNVEAVFEVGEEVPITQQTVSNGVSQDNFTTQKVALTLKITPQINKVTRFVKLKIDQKIDDFSEKVSTGGQGVGTTTRSAVTTIVVRDRDTVAMGGLMRDQKSQVVNKVPLLGDIPILGWLFKSRTASVVKLNLLLFLTPRILSPYQKETSSLVKDVLNRRSNHLKNVIGKEDPFGGTVKGLYNKAQKQGEAPLYDKEDGEKYHLENEGPGIRGRSTKAKSGYKVPNYAQITQEIQQINSSTKKSVGKDIVIKKK